MTKFCRKRGEGGGRKRETEVRRKDAGGRTGGQREGPAWDRDRRMRKVSFTAGRKEDEVAGEEGGSVDWDSLTCSSCFHFAELNST